MGQTDLIDPHLKDVCPINFTHPKFLRRLSKHHVRSELLIKAIGQGKYAHILDCTAGLGRDSLLMAGVYPKITLLERQPIVYHNLKKALDSARPHAELTEIINKIELIHTCAIEYLKQIETDCFDVIYCDPMFEEKKKKALNKKESQWLQSTVGYDLDSLQLIDLALAKAKCKVVVKRAKHADCLIRKPNIQIPAKSHRFDVYICSK